MFRKVMFLALIAVATQQSQAMAQDSYGLWYTGSPVNWKSINNYSVRAEADRQANAYRVQYPSYRFEVVPNYNGSRNPPSSGSGAGTSGTGNGSGGQLTTTPPRGAWYIYNSRGQVIAPTGAGYANSADAIYNAENIRARGTEVSYVASPSTRQGPLYLTQQYAIYYRYRGGNRTFLRIVNDITAARQAVASLQRQYPSYQFDYVAR